MSFNFETWEGFESLSKTDLDFLIDTVALNKKLADRANNPYRWRVGSFHLPKGLTPEQRERLAKQAVQRFIETFAKQGWKLESKIRVYGPYQARDLTTGAILLDRDEWRVRAIFSTRPQPVRLEVPKAVVRVDPEQKLTTKEAVRAWR